MRRWIMLLLGFSVLFPFLKGEMTFAEEPAGAWLKKEKFLGIRCGLSEESLLLAKEMGLNTVLINDDFALEPEVFSYSSKIQDLQQVSRRAKELKMHLFLGWHVLGPKSRKLALVSENRDSRGQEKGRSGEVCVSTPEYWNRVIHEPMERLAVALVGPEFQLDGFLLDTENYVQQAWRWTLGCGDASSQDEVTGRAKNTREMLESIKPGLLYGFYPIMPREGRRALWAFINGLTQAERPVLLLPEYTYEGYRPELELEKKMELYTASAGNRPVILVPGFNVLKISDPSAWKMHLHQFAKVAGGYWLYPGERLMLRTKVGSSGPDDAYAAIREANREIRELLKNPARASGLDYRRQRPDETDRAHVDELTRLARDVSVVFPGQARTPGSKASFQTGDADLLIQAGPGDPLDFSVSGRGIFAVYGSRGQVLKFQEFDQTGTTVQQPVDHPGVHSVVVRSTDQTPAEIRVGSRTWAFRGTARGTSQGTTARFLNQPGPGPFFFYVPKGTRFFRVHLSDRKQGTYIVIQDPTGREVLRQAAGFQGQDREHARQDVEVTVPPGQDGRVWSIHGNPAFGLPRTAVYGIPDLFNPDPARLITLSETALERRRSALEEKRVRHLDGATVLWVEAEEFQGGPWNLINMPAGASGEGAMFARGFRSTLSLYGEVAVPHSGKWRVWVRALAGDRGSMRRSLKLEIGGIFLEATHRWAVKSAGYVWEKAGEIDLAAGRNTLKVHPGGKAGRPSVDVIVLSDSPCWSPDEGEPSASPRILPMAQAGKIGIQESCIAGQGRDPWIKVRPLQ